MKKFLNTLWITSKDLYLSLDGENVVVSRHKEVVEKFPLHIYNNIVSFSHLGASPQLLGKCALENIGVSLYPTDSKYKCQICNNENGNVLLRRQQYRYADDEKISLEIAQNNILAKVYNTKNVLARTLRDYALRINSAKISNAIGILNDSIEAIKNVDSKENLRGIEGKAAACYFGVFDELILNQKDEFSFLGRSRRPPLDNVNAMISFGYYLLADECTFALQSVGLDPYVGYLHTERSGRKSFALDLMEEFRALMVDRLVLKLINNRQIKGDDFITTESNAVLFTKEGKDKFIDEWQKRKKEKITHPFLKEKMEWGMVPYAQSLLMARYIRGDINGYPPFMWK